MVLSNPGYLWALLGLLLPLAIHLLSRKEGKVVRVGSIRHLTESTTRKFSSIRFSQWWLFVLRALTLVLFVLILAGLSRTDVSGNLKWALLEPGIKDRPELNKTLDSLRQIGYEFRSFSLGFPLIKDLPTPVETSNYAYLLRALQQSGAQAIIFSGNRLTAFKGRQQVLPDRITWLQVENDQESRLFRATRLGGDSVALLTGSTSPESTTFKLLRKPVSAGQSSFGLPDTNAAPISIEPEKTDTVLLLVPEGFEKDAAIVQAAIAAIRQAVEKKIVVEQSRTWPDPAAGYAYVLSWAEQELPETKAAQVIRFREQSAGELLVRTGGNSWQLTRRLDREVALQQNLPILLATILLKEEKLEAEIAGWDRRAIDENSFFIQTGRVPTKTGSRTEALDIWLITFLLLTLLLERVVAYWKRS